jgi:hypothetical protein
MIKTLKSNKMYFEVYIEFFLLKYLDAIINPF